MLLAHEDKTYDGAVIASLSIPWGESASDDNLGGYHLVWPRDMCHSGTALLAAGSKEVPLRALIYLASAQNEDGGFYQNFWINGEPYWRGTQLDETAFPILFAWRLHEAKALQDFDPYPVVLKAAGYLIHHGPVTPQERWEENSGYSPSTLAAQIAALICAAAFARERGHPATAHYLEEYADFLDAHLERWTVTTDGSLVPGIRRHFIRIHPADVRDPQPDEDANHGLLDLRNQPPGAPTAFPAKDIVDAGFLELVRYGIRKPGDPLIEDSLRVVDAILRVDTPFGPCWRRYNHDGYGQREDGGPYQGWGYGHAWPLLTGERGHYELAAGRDVRPFIRAMEGVRHADLLAARASVGAAGSSRGPHELRPPHRRRHAAGLGACRVHPAGALRRGRPGRRPDLGRRRPLPHPPHGAAVGDLDIQPAGALGIDRRHPADPGGLLVPVAVDRRRMAARPGHRLHAHRYRPSLRGHPGAAGAEGSGPLHLLLDGSRTLGRAGFSGGNGAAMTSKGESEP